MTTQNEQNGSTTATVSQPVVVPTKVGSWLDNRRAALDHLRDNPLDLTIDFLKDNGLPVFVKNKSRAGQVLLLQMIDASGRRTSHRVEKTWIPQNLSDRYSYDTLMRCDDLKNMIFRQVIEILHPEDAVKQLNSPRAQEALKKFSSRFAGQNPSETEDNRKAVEGVTERMKNIVQRITVGDLTKEAGTNEVVDNFMMFSEVDFHYLYEKFAGKLEFKELVETVREEAIAQGLHK